ncbi:MAG: hypothetical protein ACYC5O_22480 [Anaerolineae bacterium]
MGLTMTRRWVLPLLATAVMLALVGAIAGALAEEPGDIVALASTPATDTFSYTGYLETDGAPANGPHDFRFSLYDAESVGTLIGSVEAIDDQPVEDGVFTVYLTCGVPQTNFSGAGRWLLVEVRPGASSGAYTALPRQPITAAPYAWSLRPWAHVSGSLPPSDLDGAILGVELTGYFPIGIALEGSTLATGSAVKGSSVSGYGLYGYSEASYAVYGFSNGTSSASPRGYGGYFTANNGGGVYGYSSAPSVHPNAYAPGVYGKSAYGVGVYARSGESGTFSAAVRAESVGANLYEGWDNNDPGIATRVFRVTNSGTVYADGGYVTGSADFAELLPAVTGLEPGDVLVVDSDGLLTRSSEALQTSVLGVYSTEPGFVGGAEDGEAPEGTVPLAVLGVVPVKASAENGAIRPGDLLVTSATPGHAMRAGDNPPQGTVVGKALGGLSDGTGVISMLVTLQ